MSDEFIKELRKISSDYYEKIYGQLKPSLRKEALSGMRIYTLGSFQSIKIKELEGGDGRLHISETERFAKFLTEKGFECKIRLYEPSCILEISW